MMPAWPLIASLGHCPIPVYQGAALDGETYQDPTKWGGVPLIGASTTGMGLCDRNGDRPSPLQDPDPLIPRHPTSCLCGSSTASRTTLENSCLPVHAMQTKRM